MSDDGRHGGGGRYSSGGGYGDRGGGYGVSDGGGRSEGYGGNSQTRGSGGHLGGRGGDERGGGRSGGSGREGDWRCTNPSCGNVNFARRLECNKCGAPYPAGSGDRGGGKTGGGYNRSEIGGGYSGNRGGRGGNYDSGNGGSGGSYGGSQGRDGGANSKGPPVLPPSYTGGTNSYPPSYGAPVGYGGGAQDPGGAPAESPVQCDENCGDTCDNSRIYVSNLPPDVTVDELRDLFGGIGQVGRIKQKRGYKDQWPWNIKIYTDDKGKNKGDACVVYEDPAAAHSAGSFYNNHDLRGYKINVAMAEKSAPRAPPVQGQRGGGRGGYGGGGDRRRDGGASGPDRSYHGGNRSRPY